MIYRFFDWDIPASSPEEFVQRLWASSWTKTLAPGAYMNEVAERAYLLEGTLLRSHDENMFVSDLVDAGYLKVIDR